MPVYTESDVLSAVREVQGGSSQRLAAQRWGVPRSTLQDRIQGGQTHKIGAKALQRLSQAQERHLCQWAITQDALGLAPSHNQVREFAQRVLTANGDHKPLGKKWMTGFLRRNPEIKTMRGKRIDSIRTNGASTERIKGFFAILAIPIVKEIPPQDRYNIDETGILEGQGSNSLVLGASHKRHTMKKQPGSRS